MLFLKNRLMQVMLAAAGICLVGAGLATAKYERNKTVAAEAAQPQPVTVPAETAITVRLDQSLDSSENRPGDTFEAHVSSPVLVDNQVVIPADAPARGRVLEAIPSGRLMKPGRLEIALSEIEVDGGWYPVATHDADRKGGSHKNRDFGWIGGGAGGGLLIGALAAGGKGALIGGPIGAGAGTAVAFMTGKKNVHLSPETRLVFHTSEPLTLPPPS
jgi:hypothetical protein